MVLVVLAVPVPVAGAKAVVAQVEASAADVAGKDTDTLIIHITEGRFFRYIERAVLFSLACYQGRKKMIRRRFCCEGGRTAKCSQQMFPCCSSNSSS